MKSNPKSVKKAFYHIIIEAHDVEDTEFQVEEVNDLTNELGQMLSFNGTVWLDDVTYETSKKKQKKTRP